MKHEVVSVACYQFFVYREHKFFGGRVPGAVTNEVIVDRDWAAAVGDFFAVERCNHFANIAPTPACFEFFKKHYFFALELYFADENALVIDFFAAM